MGWPGASSDAPACSIASRPRHSPRPHQLRRPPPPGHETAIGARAHTEERRIPGVEDPALLCMASSICAVLEPGDAHMSSTLRWSGHRSPEQGRAEEEEEPVDVLNSVPVIRLDVKKQGRDHAHCFLPRHMALRGEETLRTNTIRHRRRRHLRNEGNNARSRSVR